MWNMKRDKQMIRINVLHFQSNLESSRCSCQIHEEKKSIPFVMKIFIKWLMKMNIYQCTVAQWQICYWDPSQILRLQMFSLRTSISWHKLLSNSSCRLIKPLWIDYHVLPRGTLFYIAGKRFLTNESIRQGISPRAFVKYQENQNSIFKTIHRR